jgi:acetyl-CoA/propionyl-CoA carboxylase biotin carboxyl carrier protein
VHPQDVAGGGSGTATTPMQASVVKVAVTEGQHVLEGDLLVVLEAMKMEQPITAERAGIVRDLDAPLGQTVPAGHVLLRVADE